MIDRLDIPQLVPQKPETSTAQQEPTPPQPSPQPAVPPQIETTVRQEPPVSVAGHDIFWRDFNDALEPAHGSLGTFQLGAQEMEVRPATEIGQQSQIEAQPDQAQPGIMAKYWPWFLGGTVLMLGVAFALSWFKKRRKDDDQSRPPDNPGPEKPEPPRTNSGHDLIKSLLPY